MKLTILGSGTDASQIPGIPNRYPPGFLVEWDQEKVLFDCSEGVRFRLEKVGVDYASIRHLAISHSHPDHYALPQFLQSVWNKGLWGGKHFTDHDLHIYGPKELVADYKKLWHMYHPDFDNVLPLPRLKFHEMSDSESFEVSGAKLTAEKVHHGFGKLDAVGFRLEHGGSVFAYSGDTGECEGVGKIAQDADVFVCEASSKIGEDNSREYGHLNPFQVGNIAKQARVKKLVLFHYSGLDPDDKIIAECRRSGYKGEIVIGKDFEEFEF